MGRGFTRFTATVADPGLRLPLSADRAPGDLLLQRLQAGHRLGRLLAPVVRGAAAATRRCWTRPGSRCGSPPLSSTLALVLGTMAGVVLTRIARFPGRTLFAGMISAPLVMPEVILGLSLLLLFVSLGVARGFWTIVIAHTTFAMCYVTVVVQSRLVTFDRSLEEAAMDLGAPPLKTFFVITLPIIAPGPGRRLAARLHPLARRPGHRQLHHRPGCHHPADADLQLGAPGRDARDQRHLHRPDRPRDAGRGGRHPPAAPPLPAAARQRAGVRPGRSRF